MVIDYFKIEPLQPLSTKNFNSDLNNQVSIFPNPARDEINIKITNNSVVKKMELFSILSSKVHQIKNIDFNSNKIQKIDVSNLKKGVYFLKLELMDGNTITKKLLKF